MLLLEQYDLLFELLTLLNSLQVKFLQLLNSHGKFFYRLI